MSYSEAKIKNKSVAEIDFPIVGCNEDHIKIADRTMMKGTFIQQYHVQNSAKVIVLGFAAAEQLFKNTNPLGQIVEVNKINFTVIGVLQKINDSGSHNDPNKDCYAPVSSVKKYLKQSFDGVLNGIFIASQNDKVIPETIRQITKIMRAQHKLDKDDPNDFAIYDQKGMLAAAQKSSDIFTLFLLIVAFIALLIGGIGVMNIMLVAVGERTQEIGIRKAVGATQSTILKQFILEALTLCIIGGIIGIILGIAVPLLVSKFTGLPVIFTTMSIIIVTITIIFVGLIFGYYPALKAANMNPINALSD
jgi:putative ABC transport system permease protein